MAKVKKQKRYVPSTNVKVTGREGSGLMWEKRKEFSYDQLMSWAKDYLDKTHYGKYESGEKSVADWKARLESHNITPENWQGDHYDGKWTWPMSQILSNAFYVSPYFEELNTAFLAEYDSRPDLQEIYQKFYDSTNWITDRYDNSYTLNQYFRNGVDSKYILQQRELYKVRPESYVMWNSVVERAEAKKFIEVSRPTPYQEGDLVKLRSSFIGRRDIDPMFASYYDVSVNGATPTPDKTVDRIGTLIAITDDTAGWRGSAGSKILEVLWIGKDDTVKIAERMVKWEERPTYKNGMKKR